MNTQRERTWAGIAMIVLSLGLLPATGCIDLDDDDDMVMVEVDTTAPAPPSGVVSTTGDLEVRLIWNPNTEPDLDGYRVWWSPDAEGPYEMIATTSINRFVDRDVENGVTYFYAVTAVDLAGNESELSHEMVHDTPRPEGFNLVLFNYVGDSWELSGYDFSGFVRRPFDATDTDIYFGVEEGRYSMIAGHPQTDLQDGGYAALDDLDWAPPRGWTNEDRVTLVEGHSYYVWTHDDHFAKFRVVALSADRVTIDWAYQIDKSNPELMAPQGSE
jgi:hypothetical protein